jgi:hypothetical protein
MQLLEPILHIPALTVDRIDPGRRVIKIGHHEPRVAAGIPPGEPDDLGLDDHATAMGPAPGRVEGLAKHVLGVAAVLRESVGGRVRLTV